MRAHTQTSRKKDTASTCACEGGLRKAYRMPSVISVSASSSSSSCSSRILNHHSSTHTNIIFALPHACTKCTHTHTHTPDGVSKGDEGRSRCATLRRQISHATTTARALLSLSLASAVCVVCMLLLTKLQPPGHSFGTRADLVAPTRAPPP
jgi:hypothetical protein